MIPPMLNIHQIFLSVDFEALIISPKINNLLVSKLSHKMGSRCLGPCKTFHLYNSEANKP
jgi:hypothetical protein